MRTRVRLVRFNDALCPGEMQVQRILSRPKPSKVRARTGSFLELKDPITQFYLGSLSKFRGEVGVAPVCVSDSPRLTAGEPQQLNVWYLQTF